MEGRHGILSQLHLGNTKTSWAGKELLKFEVSTMEKRSEDLENEENRQNEIPKEESTGIKVVCITEFCK